jgi:hypothetical protein
MHRALWSRTDEVLLESLPVVLAALALYVVARPIVVIGPPRSPVINGCPDGTT